MEILQRLSQTMWKENIKKKKKHKVVEYGSWGSYEALCKNLSENNLVEYITLKNRAKKVARVMKDLAEKKIGKRKIGFVSNG